MTVTVTNRAVTSNSFTANGSSRVFTNVTGALTVATNLTSINATKTNLFNQIAAFPFTGVTLVDGNTNGLATTNTFRLIGYLGGPLSGSITGISASVSWGFITLSTQSAPNLYPMLWPLANVPQTTNQTNQASDVVNQLNTWPTNSIATNASAFANYLTKGAHSNQVVTSPVHFTGTVSADKELLATNGYTKGLTNINSVSSNHINYGNAIRSEGSGANSFQAGSNALSLGALSLSIGNTSRATNAGDTVVGNNSIVSGPAAVAMGQNLQVIGEGSVGIESNVRGYASVGIGYAQNIVGSNAVGIGTATITSDRTIGIGYNVSALQLSAMAVGDSAYANHSNSAAIGPRDDQGTAVETTTTNQIMLGTSRQRISAPGLYESPKGTNSTFAGTNIARGSWSYPAFALATLAAGNNISVPFGTNVYIRCNAGPASAATICGIIGGATSGGLDGQIVEVFNDTGFSLTFAQNTVDPVAANRINTPLGTDVTIADQASARLMYDGTDARWKLTFYNSITASATNAVASVNGAATNLNTYQTAGNTALTVNPLIGAGGNRFTIKDTNGNAVAFMDTNNVFNTSNLTVKGITTNESFIIAKGSITANSGTGADIILSEAGAVIWGPTLSSELVENGSISIDAAQGINYGGYLTGTGWAKIDGPQTNVSDHYVQGNSILKGATNASALTNSGTIFAESNILVRAGQSTSNAWVGGTIFYSDSSFTNLNGTPGTLTNLGNCSIPANMLTNRGDYFYAEWEGVMPAAAANTNRFKIVYGSETILDTGLQIASNTTFFAWCKVSRTGNTGQHAWGHLEWGPGGAVPFAFTNANLELVQTNGIATTLALQGASQRVGAHTNNAFRVEYRPVPR